MPKQNPKKVAKKLQTVMDAWEALRATKSFAGMTLEQFKQKVLASQTARVQLQTSQNLAKEHLALRHTTDATNWELAQLVVNSVKGDPEEGETSGLYAAMGYVPKNQRRSGLTRKGETTPPIVVTATPK
jgi:hypothetical protein